MSSVALLGAVELGLIYGLVALGVFMTFRVLDFPDLTVDGSFPLGAAVAAVLLVAGWPPVASTAAAGLAGSVAGLVTAYITVRCRILHLLAGILTMIALFSVNLRIMGRPNIALLGHDTVFSAFSGASSEAVVRPLALAALLAACLLAAWAYLASEKGLAMRAAGANPRMARAAGVHVEAQVMAGVAASNGLIGVGGALFAQANGFADVTSGIGTIVVGLAAVIIGETLLPTRQLFVQLVAVVAGSVFYRLAVQLLLGAEIPGLQASDLSFATAALVLAALTLPQLRRARPA
jgi:putative ABC transport system permease protein